MLDITTVILTYNEELHIQRCLDNVTPFSKRVIVVDCHSVDKTLDICAQYPIVEVIQHDWPGNQAEQFNWALDSLKINTQWILRLDADEYLTPELINELQENLPKIDESVSAISLSRARAFCGKMLKHGISNDVKIIRIFRTGKARYENRIMDEHLNILEGETIEMKNKFVDDSRISFSQFINKHNNYASREAFVLLDQEFHLTENGDDISNNGDSVNKKRKQKARYARFPLFWRAFGYFVYRYFFKLGFLDGKEGFLWDFFQGLWYRMLVDAKIYEVKKACGNDKEKIKEYLAKEYNIKV